MSYFDSAYIAKFYLDQAGYLRRPEGPGEIKAAEAAAVQLLSTEKWWMRLSEARGESTAP